MWYNRNIPIKNLTKGGIFYAKRKAEQKIHTGIQNQSSGNNAQRKANEICVSDVSYFTACDIKEG